MKNRKLKAKALEDWINEAEGEIGNLQMDLNFILCEPKWIKRLFKKFDNIDELQGTDTKIDREEFHNAVKEDLASH